MAFVPCSVMVLMVFIALLVVILLFNIFNMYSVSTSAPNYYPSAAANGDSGAKLTWIKYSYITR